MIFFSPSRVDAGNGARSIHSGMWDGACFWKKCFPCQPSGIALHGERTPAQVRHEHLRDLAVVRDEVALRDALVGPEGLVEVAQAKLAAAPLHDLGDGRPLAADLLCRLVVAQTHVDGRAQPPLARPLDELDLGHERRLDPDDVAAADAGHLRHLRERRVLALERAHELQQAVDLLVREAGADVPRPAEPARLVNADDQRAEAVAPPPLPAGVAGDDDLLASAHLDLPPLGPAPPGEVPRVLALRDHALEPLLAWPPRGALARRRSEARRRRLRPTGRRRPRAGDGAPRARGRRATRNRSRARRRGRARGFPSRAGGARSASSPARRVRRSRRRGQRPPCGGRALPPAPRARSAR